MGQAIDLCWSFYQFQVKLNDFVTFLVCLWQVSAILLAKRNNSGIQISYIC